MTFYEEKDSKYGISGSKYVTGSDAKVNIDQLKATQRAQRDFSESRLSITYGIFLLHNRVCLYD